jgi:hypothetical protein
VCVCIYIYIVYTLYIILRCTEPWT